MQKTFRFWGYAPDVFAALVGENRPVRMDTGPDPRPVFGQVEVARELAGRFGPLGNRCSSGWLTWLMVDRSLRVDGHPLAWIRPKNGTARPILSGTPTDGFQFWFDVDGTVEFIQNEGYATHAPPGYLKLGIMPDQMPRWVRKAACHGLHWFKRLRRRREPPFPAEPSDPAVDCWRFLVRSIVEEHAPTAGIPLWPEGKEYAVVLTHDVDSDFALRHRRALDRLRKTEEKVEARSAWLVVTKLLGTGLAALDDLYAAGHEIGFHGTRHDHRLAFLPPISLAERIKSASVLIERFRARGFRSPASLRTPAMFHALDGSFEYDMSMHDAISHPATPTSGTEGCSTCHPFLIGGTDLLEIPTTVPEEWYCELRGLGPEETLQRQLEALDRVGARGGVANVLAHPEPQLSLREPWLEVYRRLVERVAADERAWLVRPGDLNRHWRSRRTAIDALWDNVKESGAPPSATSWASELGGDRHEHATPAVRLPS